MGLQSFLQLVPESVMTSQTRFLSLVSNFTPYFFQFLNAGDVEAMKFLQQAGWGNTISKEMKIYLMNRFMNMYKLTDSCEIEQMVARYFASVLARKKEAAYGEGFNWTDGKLEISFLPPMPDTPKNSTRVFLRTVPFNMSSLHLPCWRSRVFVKKENSKFMSKLGVCKTEDTQKKGLKQCEFLLGDKETQVNLLYFMQY